MNIDTWLLVMILFFIWVDFFLELALDILNQKHRAKPLPPLVAGIYDSEKRSKSTAYYKALLRVDLFQRSLSTALITALLASGFFGWLDGTLREAMNSELLTTLAFFGILYGASTLLSLPVSWYKTFHIEQEFGFNRSTARIFWQDRLKALVLTLILGGGLLSLLWFFWSWAGPLFWLYAWLTVAFLSILITVFYTSWFLPLFNKLKPLEDGQLRTGIEQYARSVSFPLTGIFVMDGSKRSSKGNAFFSGLGKRKRIVLYDTLIEQHSVPELIAVLAHEVGHYKKKHVVQGLMLSQIQSIIMFLLLGWALNRPEFSQALGSSGISFELGLLAFALLYSPVSMLSGLGMSVLSRHNEFEADRWAVKTSKGSDLASALSKLSVDHLSNPNPHPAYVFFHYSHPPLLSRLKAIKECDSDINPAQN